MRSWLPSGLLSSRAQNPCPRTPACQRKPGARKTKDGAPEGGPFSRRGAPPSGAIARCQPCRARRPKQFRRGLCAAALVPKACRAVLWSPRFLLFARQSPHLSSLSLTGRRQNRENPITRNLELTLPDKRGVGNQICWNNARFFEYTGTNAFSRIQKGYPRIAYAQKPGIAVLH